MRIQAALLALTSAALALPESPQATSSEFISLKNVGMVLDRDSETKIVGFSLTLIPSLVQCDAANFTLPSPKLKCGDSSYTFALYKIPEYYSRFVVELSHSVENGYVNPEAYDTSVKTMERLMRCAAELSLWAILPLAWLGLFLGSVTCLGARMGPLL